MVNAVLVTSLSSSMGASLAIILAKDWVSRYGDWMAKQNLVAHETAREHQRRHLGILKWRFSIIISVIPWLIHNALMLFAVAMVVLFWFDNKAVAVVNTLLFGVIFVAYWTISLLPLAYSDCPFRTPTSDLMTYEINLLKFLYHRFRIPPRMRNFISKGWRRWASLKILSWRQWNGIYTDDHPAAKLLSRMEWGELLNFCEQHDDRTSALDVAPR